MLLSMRDRKPVPYILDRIRYGGITGAGCSYSLRKLRKNYTGPCINIRRSSDNATADIGFTSNGDLDISAINTFVGANSAFVVTWYDQSGNIRHATQATTGLQPRIVNAGALDTLNSRPAILFTQASGQFLGGFDVRFMNGTQYTINAVEARTSTATTPFFMGNVNNGANNTGLHFGYADNTDIINGQVGNDLTIAVSGYTSTVAKSRTAILSNTNRVVYENGVSIGSLGSATALTLTIANNGLVGAGYNNVSATCFDGYLQEVHFFSRNLQGMRTVLERSQSKYFGV